MTYSTLFDAIRGGDMALLTALLDQGADPDAADAIGLTPLHIAVLYCCEEAVELLLNRVAKASKAIHAKTREQSANIVCYGRDRYIDRPGVGGGFYLPEPNVALPDGVGLERGATPLHIAAMLGHVSILRRFIAAKARTAALDACGITPLHLAARFGHIGAVSLLLATKAGAKAIQKGSKVRKSLHMHDTGTTALHAGLESGDMDVIRSLIDAGADIHACTKEGCSSVFFAARGGSVEALELLFSLGLSAKTPVTYSTFPLREAVLCGHLDMVKALVAAGSPTQEPQGAQSPLRYATKANRLDLRDALLDGGAAPLKDFGVHSAVRDNDTTYVRAYLARGGDPNFLKDNVSLLMRAATDNHLEIAQLLVQHGADINLLTPQGHALGWSMLKRINDVTYFLLDLGVDCSLTNEHGNQVLTLGRIHRHIPHDTSRVLVWRMLELGFDPDHVNNYGLSCRMIVERDQEALFLEILADWDKCKRA